MSLPTLNIWETLSHLMNGGVIYVITHDTDKAGNRLEVPQTTYYVFSEKSPETGIHTFLGNLAAQDFVTLFQNKLIWRVPIRGVNNHGEPIYWYRLRKTTYATLGKWPGIVTEYIGKRRENTEDVTEVEETPVEAPVKKKRSIFDIFKKG